MYEDWPETTKVLSGQLRNLRGGVPEVMKAFSGIAQTALAPKALDAKTKELIALGIGIAIRCDDCIAFHINRWQPAMRRVGARPTQHQRGEATRREAGRAHPGDVHMGAYDFVLADGH